MKKLLKIILIIFILYIIAVLICWKINNSLRKLTEVVVKVNDNGELLFEKPKIGY